MLSEQEGRRASPGRRCGRQRWPQGCGVQVGSSGRHPPQVHPAAPQCGFSSHRTGQASDAKVLVLNHEVPDPDSPLRGDPEPNEQRRGAGGRAGHGSRCTLWGGGTISFTGRKGVGCCR